MSGIESHARTRFSPTTKTPHRFFQTYSSIDELIEDYFDYIPNCASTAAFKEKEEQSLYDLYAPASMRKRLIPGLVEQLRDDPSQDVQDLLEIWDSLDIPVCQSAF